MLLQFGYADFCVGVPDHPDHDLEEIGETPHVLGRISPLRACL